MLKQCQNLCHWDVCKRNLFASANAGHSLVLFSSSGFRVDLSYSLRDPLKDPQFNLLGPQQNFNLSHNRPVSILPTDHFSVFTMESWKRLEISHFSFLSGMIILYECAYAHARVMNYSHSEDCLTKRYYVLDLFITHPSTLPSIHHPPTHPSIHSLLAAFFPHSDHSGWSWVRVVY